MSPKPIITPDKFDAVLFDLDGVITATAKIHAACWKRMFDDFLSRRAVESGRGRPRIRRGLPPSAAWAISRTKWSKRKSGTEKWTSIRTAWPWPGMCAP